MRRRILVFLCLSCLITACSNHVRPSQEKHIRMLRFVYKGKAKSVFMAGNFNNWKVDDPRYRFKLKEDDTWELVLPETYFLKGENEYKLIVDGEWVVDKNAPEKRNTKLAGQIGVFKIE